MLFLAISINWIWVWVRCFNRPCLDMAYFYSEIGLEIAFWATLQNRKQQMPSSEFTYTLYTQWVYSIHIFPLLNIASIIGQALEMEPQNPFGEESSVHLYILAIICFVVLSKVPFPKEIQGRTQDGFLSTINRSIFTNNGSEGSKRKRQGALSWLIVMFELSLIIFGGN